MMPCRLARSNMRGRLLADLASPDGVDWVVIIGEDALPMDYAPADSDLADATAQWSTLQAKVGSPMRMTVRGDEATLLSHRIDAVHSILMRISTDGNLGASRAALADAAGRLVDLV
jgi:predicted regulator of Ras-like GTPase activity (Roadblock/LC7/MglB family)